MNKAAAVVRAMKAAKLDVDIFTGTGTGTCDIDHEIKELTDMQVGSYCLLDAEYLACHSRDSSRLYPGLPPLTMLSTIVSTTHAPKFVTIDCGLKAMYKDGATPEVSLFPWSPSVSAN
jgi:D-serine deaminase-like pyridoxal phosphate-dependent protein